MFRNILYALLDPSMLVQLTPASPTNFAVSHEYFSFLFHASIMSRMIRESIIGYKCKECIVRHEIHPIHVMTIEVKLHQAEQESHDQRYRVLVKSIALGKTGDDAADVE